jgi:hypothetical protein
VKGCLTPKSDLKGNSKPSEHFRLIGKAQSDQQRPKKERRRVTGNHNRKLMPQTADMNLTNANH